MKNRIIITTIIAVLFPFLQGCDGFLTVDIPDSLTKEDYWKSEDDANAALSGVYRQLGVNIPLLIKWGGLRADIYAPGGSFGGNESQFINQDVRITNGLVNWGSVYTGINYANSFLKNAHLVMEHDRSFTAAKLHAMEGQAYAIRALYYFYLVRAFQDVPYTAEPYESDTQSPYAAAVPETTVLDSIEADLQRALAYAPQSFDVPRENYGYITRKAVLAIWADVKLWRGKYEECIDLCDEVSKEMGAKMLVADTWFSMFSAGNSIESIFEYQYPETGPNSTVGPLFNNTLAANSKAMLYNVRKAYPPAPGQTVSDTVRYKRTVVGIGNRAYAFKYVGISAEANDFVVRDATGLNKVNFIFYRYREVLLMKAEALGMLGRYNEAVEMINKIREATSLETTTAGEFGTGEVFMDKLICERVAELAFEGKEWFTLVRIARNTGFIALLVDRVAENSASGVKEQNLKARLQETDSWFLPYWETETDNNRLLKQKAFYKGKR